MPHVVIDGITVGKTEDLKVGKVTVTPELSSLFSATKVIRSIEIDSLVLTQKAIDKIPVWSKQDGKPGEAPAVRIGSLRLDDALVKLDKTSFGPFDARVRLDDKGQPAEASITTRDGKLKAVVTPENSKYAISASAKTWTVPAGPPIVFDELEIRGVATLTDATFSQVSAKLYGGTAVGKATVSWQKGLQLKGNVDLAQIELTNLVPIISPGTKMSGRLNAKPVFSAAAADGSQLLAALHLETPFDVQHGVLHGVDIQKAAMNLIRKDSGGGETHFDQLSGHVVRDRLAYKFSGLKISSGVLAADGDVGISPKQELSGRVNAKVNALGTSARRCAECFRHGSFAKRDADRGNHRRRRDRHRDPARHRHRRRRQGRPDDRRPVRKGSRKVASEPFRVRMAVRPDRDHGGRACGPRHRLFPPARVRARTGARAR